MKTLILFLLLPFFLFSNQPDDIKLKNGSAIINCKIVDSTNTYYTVQTTLGLRNINRAAISIIYFSSFDSTKETTFTSDIPKLREQVKYNPNNSNVNEGYEQPYILLLAISGALAYLSYDYFDTASDYSKLLDSYPSDSEAKSDAESKQTKYVIGGIVFGVAAIVNTIFALKKVKIINTNNSIGLSYNF